MALGVVSAGGLVVTPGRLRRASNKRFNSTRSSASILGVDWLAS
jgi:hypothetical protein